jgi:hypothetical protein
MYYALCSSSWLSASMMMMFVTDRKLICVHLVFLLKLQTGMRTYFIPFYYFVVLQLKGAIEKPWSHGQRWKTQGFKCGYCSVEASTVATLRNSCLCSSMAKVACSSHYKKFRQTDLWMD